MAKGNHSFAEQDIHSRFNAIVGHTVAEVDTAGVLTASSASRNKGRVGAVIERSVLGYPADSDRRPDILIDGQPWEVKVTGLVEVARGGWRAKEPMSITAVAPEGIVAESFTTSAFWHKAARLLVVYYLYVRPGRGVAVEYAGFEFKGYDLHTWREVDRCRLEADWTLVRDFVRTALGGDVDTEMPNLSTLVNPHLLYLDTSPKWPNRPRFRLKASLVTQMARERLDDGMRMIPDQGGLSSMNALKAHLHETAETYGGQTLEELAAPFNLPLKAKSGKENKSLAEQVVVRLFTGHAGKISQVPLFAKAGLVFKTMTLTPAGGRTEDMKLNPSIDFDELCDTSVEFEGSAFAAPFIDSTMVVAVLEERYRDCPLRSCATPKSTATSSSSTATSVRFSSRSDTSTPLSSTMPFRTASGRPRSTSRRLGWTTSACTRSAPCSSAGNLRERTIRAIVPICPLRNSSISARPKPRNVSWKSGSTATWIPTRAR